MPTIRLEKATKTYKWNDRKIPAAQHIDLEIVQGEFVFVVGSSGAGKSTLLKLMDGEIKPESGAVYLDDQ
ncbi:MAG: ATP-binding cassette domain-containing protein, partial [Oscillospiraceae bacterium]